MPKRNLLQGLIEVNASNLNVQFNDPMKRLKFLLLGGFACVLILSGCESQPGTESGGEFTVQQSATSGLGRYKLVAVNGQSVPASVAHRYAQIKVHSGDFTLRADGTCSTTTTFSAPSAGKDTRVSHCTYERQGASLSMTWQGAGKNTGVIDGETFTMDNHGMEFSYQLVQPISTMSQLDLAGECDQSVIDAGIPRAEPGVFDDFERDLVSGRNADGISIGFLTFQGSQTTRVAISKTGKHPPRPDESDSNSVLQLDVDVREWAGVIHGFENTEVNRWSPRDWSALSELRFWLYGNNRQTTLFVEILDNRKPCPNAAGAEVFTYQFTDDFTGWREIVVPFDRFTRKEIYNDAPNDGLNLDAVHGWAFGFLDSGGPTTYYLDDFEVR